MEKKITKKKENKQVIVKKSLRNFLEEKGNEAELESLRKFPDSDYSVKVSAYNKVRAKLESVIAFLDALYEIEENDDNVNLVVKRK